MVVGTGSFQSFPVILGTRVERHSFKSSALDQEGDRAECPEGLFQMTHSKPQMDPTSLPLTLKPQDC